MKKLLKTITIVLFAVVVLIPTTLFAQNKNYTYRGQIVEPVFTVLNLKRNDTYEGSIHFVNDLEIAYTLNLVVTKTDFRANTDGTSKDETVKYPPQASLSSWISLDKTKISVKQGEYADVKFTIKVPSDADYGGKYASISFERNTQSTDAPSQIPIQTRIQHTLLVNIEGNRMESLEIANFKADKSSYSETNVNFNTDIRNSGNVHLAPRGKIEITGGIIGDGMTMIFNPAGKESLGFVLPDKNVTRQFTNQWNDRNIRFGEYKAVLTVEYGDPASPKTTTAVLSFWIVPWRYIFIILGIALFILLLVIGIVFYRHKMKLNPHQSHE